MSLENIQKIKQGVNTANLLNHLETEIEPPKQFGLRFRFQGVIDKIIQQLKTLNTAVYGHDNISKDASFLSLDNKYYDSVLSWGPDFNWLAYYNDISVGSMSCKIDESTKSLQIVSIAVLSKYRRLGVASKLYEKIQFIAEHNPDVKRVYVHVQVDNEAACKFFEKLGFKQEKTIDVYTGLNVTSNVQAYEYSKTL